MGIFFFLLEKSQELKKLRIHSETNNTKNLRHYELFIDFFDKIFIKFKKSIKLLK